jgi:hypothetical protein
MFRLRNSFSSVENQAYREGAAMNLRQMAVLLLPLALSGCQPPPPVVLAMIEHGAIVLHIREHGLLLDRIFGWDDERHPVDRLWITYGPRTIIRLAPHAGSRKGCVARTTFPVQLGESRCGFAWSGGQDDLQPGIVYAIRLISHQQIEENMCSPAAGGGDCRYERYWSASIVGAFKIGKGGGITNLRPSEFPDECSAHQTEDSAIQEEWAEHCVAEPEKKAVGEEGGAAREGAHEQPD